jgi:hypothetical protein
MINPVRWNTKNIGLEKHQEVDIHLEINLLNHPLP